jgi:hypothetical protein
MERRMRTSGKHTWHSKIVLIIYHFLLEVKQTPLSNQSVINTWVWSIQSLSPNCNNCAYPKQPQSAVWFLFPPFQVDCLRIWSRGSWLCNIKIKLVLASGAECYKSEQDNGESCHIFANYLGLCSPSNPYFLLMATAQCWWLNEDGANVWQWCERDDIGVNEDSAILQTKSGERDAMAEGFGSSVYHSRRPASPPRTP